MGRKVKGYDMRNILFKGKSRDNGEWIEGTLCDALNHKFVFIFPKMLFDPMGDLACSIRTFAKPVRHSTLCQFTGMSDKNGKKIYESDIVKADDYIFCVRYGKCGGVPNTKNYGYLGFYLEAVSEETKRCAKYGLRNDICYYANLEVIGNIHDNPELMKEV